MEIPGFWEAGGVIGGVIALVNRDKYTIEVLARAFLGIFYGVAAGFKRNHCIWIWSPELLPESKIKYRMALHFRSPDSNTKEIKSTTHILVGWHKYCWAGGHPDGVLDGNAVRGFQTPTTGAACAAGIDGEQSSTPTFADLLDGQKTLTLRYILDSEKSERLIAPSVVLSNAALVTLACEHNLKRQKRPLLIAALQAHSCIWSYLIHCADAQAAGLLILNETLPLLNRSQAPIPGNETLSPARRHNRQKVSIHYTESIDASAAECATMWPQLESDESLNELGKRLGKRLLDSHPMLRQRSASGNVCIHPHEISTIAAVLSRPMSTLYDEIVVISVSDENEATEDMFKRTPFLVRRGHTRHHKK
ncbi:hypothetical protein DFH09DRAFT_1091443 [Mycena vulgaris]|nr:hypothetical protein DFH09DRAFT_1091443 [Mycena vulgaris]